jgi:hypothetical protein
MYVDVLFHVICYEAELTMSMPMVNHCLLSLALSLFPH